MISKLITIFYHLWNILQETKSGAGECLHFLKAWSNLKSSYTSLCMYPFANHVYYIIWINISKLRFTKRMYYSHCMYKSEIIIITGWVTFFWFNNIHNKSALFTLHEPTYNNHWLVEWMKTLLPRQIMFNTKSQIWIQTWTVTNHEVKYQTKVSC